MSMSKSKRIHHAITLPYLARFCNKPINQRFREQGESFEGRHTINFSVVNDENDGYGEIGGTIVEEVNGLDSFGSHKWYPERAINQAGATVISSQYPERQFRIRLRLQASDSITLDESKDLIDQIFSPEHASVAYPPSWGSVGALVDVFGSYPPCIERNPWTYTKRRSDGTYRHADFFPLSVEVGGFTTQRENVYSLTIEVLCTMYDPFVYGSERTLYFNGDTIARADWDGSVSPVNAILEMPCYEGTRPAPYLIEIDVIKPPEPNEMCGIGFSLAETGNNRVLAHSNLNAGGTCWPIFQVSEEVDRIRLDTRTFTQNFSITNINDETLRQLDGNLDPNAATIAEMLLVPQHTHRWFMITDTQVQVGDEGKPLATLKYSPRYGNI